MSEDFSGMTEDDWFNSDYMDEEDYRSVHGASNVGDFSWSGQDMWNTSPAQSNDMHGLLGGSFNAFTDTTNNTVTGGAINPITGLPVESGRGLIDMVRQNAVKNNLTQQQQPSDIPQIDVTKPLAFEVDVRPKDLGMFPAAHIQPSFADKMANMNKGLISGIGDFAKDAVRNTVGVPFGNWYDNMDRVSQSTTPFDPNQSVVSQMNPNFDTSVAKEFKGVIDMAISPIETGKAAINLASGALQHLVPDTLAWNQVDKDMASAVGQAINTKYGSVGGWQKALSEDPFEAISLLTGVGFLGKGVLGGMGKVIDPTTVDKVTGKFGITPMPKLNIAPVGGKPWAMKSKGEGDFYIKRVGPNAGKVSKTREGPSDIAFSVDQDVLLPDFAYYAVMSLQESLKSRAHGSVQQAINQHDVDDILTKFFQEQNGQGSPSAVPKLDEGVLGQVTDMKNGTTLYHGGDLPNDKFDISKTGSGQGMSTNGWGINLTSSPKTAGAYKTMLDNKGGKGSVYTVDVDDVTFINREKVLSEQTQTIQDIAKAIDSDVDLNTITGKTLYSELTKIHGSKQAASEFLDSMGVKGISFPDGYIGDGRNHVVFDDSIITVLKKDGEELLGQPNTDYRLAHTAARAEKGTSLDDVSNIFPDDITDPNFQRYYGMGGEYTKADLETIDVMKRASGRPDAMVTIYRAVPIGVKEINAGDWVSTSKSYATSHGERHIDDGYDLITKEVRASELNTDGDLHEWGYNPITKPLYTGEQALITQHNTSAENIMKMRDHDGKIPGPSVAAVSTDNLMTPDQFGGVSLFSDSDLANPESLVSSTWTGDAYTIRAPDEYLHYVNEDAVKAQFTPEQLEFFSIGEHTSMPSPGMLEGDMLFADLLEEIGEMDRTKYDNFSEMLSAASDPEVLGWTEASDIKLLTHDEPFFGEVNRTMRTKGLSAEDSSHTYPLYNPEAATADMLSKGAHKSGTEFGEEVKLPLEDALALALAQRKYETLDQIKDDRSRIMGSNSTQRDAWGDMFYDVEGKVEDILDTKDGDLISAVLSSALSGEPLNAPHSGFKVDMLATPVTEYQWEQIMTLVNPMKEFALKMDVNYLEAKPRRIVNANEFKGAAIPTGKPQLRTALEEMGVTKIFEYSNKQEHANIAKKFPELFYNQQPTGLMDELQ